ncbi:hypothetical protein SmJEL517_g00451 [Synchytrium microbalum]|uniref:NADP-dependent oxidoreductase domain-containing protein n=1 Tax=Synchytrium microbalum TaxID=1806994 RepID=A0A507CDI3_9FUNG|nr:uncharacterized protein SmJEL517_g00451 [Synchytrium microbalum]TPX37561.1 hypothetical protein SmJEL517_g00451 [Synchytrium microbalum]
MSHPSSETVELATLPSLKVLPFRTTFVRQSPRPASMPLTQSITLNDGNNIPVIAKGKECAQAVTWALQAGYRHIDTAQIYGNEEQVAAGILASGVPRSEIYITTKVYWNSSSVTQQDTIQKCEESLRKLKTDYVDLYLIHAPQPGTRKETWLALESLKKAGKAKSIGISNYGVHHIKEMDEYATIVPAVNQFEVHPFLAQDDVVAECKARGIAVEAWGSVTRGRDLEDPRLVAIAGKYGKTSAQILLRWAVDQGYIIIPKSVHKNRIIENQDVFDFKLDEGDLKEMATFNVNSATGWVPQAWE